MGCEPRQQCAGSLKRFRILQFAWHTHVRDETSARGVQNRSKVFCIALTHKRLDTGVKPFSQRQTFSRNPQSFCGYPHEPSPTILTDCFSRDQMPLFEVCENPCDSLLGTIKNLWNTFLRWLSVVHYYPVQNSDATLCNAKTTMFCIHISSLFMDFI